MTINLTLAAPPTANTYWRHVVIGRRARTLISERGRKYQKSVAQAVAMAGKPSIDGRLAVKLSYAPPDRRRRDLDNICKASLDAMQKAGVYADDSQIDRLVVVRLPVTNGGCLLVEILNC